MRANSLILRPSKAAACKVVYLVSQDGTNHVQKRSTPQGKYKPSFKTQEKIHEKTADTLPGSQLPELRGVIETTDYNSGQPVTHRIELYRSDRIDCYRAVVDGQLWKTRIGWSLILAGLRKAMPQIRQID